MVPLPCLTKFATPAMGTAMLRVTLLASTEESRAPLERVRTAAGLPELVRVQALLEATVSAKKRLPMVRLVSTWTVMSEVRLKLLKLALKVAPLATIPPDQFAGALQFPPMVLVQVPLTANAG